MILSKPTTIVKRLVVMRNDNVAYDEKFDRGINVIRGENSSGKSTILNFLFFGMGGNLLLWSDYALLCTHVFIEVELNASTLTFRREVDERSMTPMSICGGGYDYSIKAPVTEWHTFPYRRSSSSESFSQAIFRLLEIPEVTSDLSGNVTFHQVLRLIYSDQLTSPDSIFRAEPMRLRDEAALRETVGNLISGAYDADVYNSERLKKQKEKEYDQIESELRSIYKVLGSRDESVGVDWVIAQQKNLIQDRMALVEQVTNAENQLMLGQQKEKITLTAQNDALLKVQKLQTQLSISQEEKRKLEFDISDSEMFIRSLQNKIKSLNQAGAVTEHLHDVFFNTCPACFSALQELPEEMNACGLCKTPFDSARARERIVAMINEAAIQLKQSEHLQANRLKDFATIDEKILSVTSEWRHAANELQALQKSPLSESRQKLKELHRGLGYVDRQIEDIESKMELARKIDTLKEQKRALNDEIENLKTYIDSLLARLGVQINKSRLLIETQVKRFLVNDLSRQDAFENPDSVEFSFAKNEITVDGQTYFSASSRVILKNSFYLGLLSASLIDPNFRHPRLLIMNTTEDKGMEVSRSHNFQRLMMNLSDEANAVHQIIYATSMISNEIPESSYVGKYSTTENKTLNIA